MPKDLRCTSGGAPLHSRGSQAPPVCTAHGCARTTKGRKPFCSDHVRRMPYSQGVEAELARSEGEDRDAASGRPSIHALSVREIKSHLFESGAMTLAQMIRRTDIDHPALVAYLDLLQRRGVVERIGGKRSPAYALTDEAFEEMSR